MSEQRCDACEYGRERHCYWPYYADNDGDSHDAIFDPMPPWAEREIEYNSGQRISEHDCARCPCFLARSEEEPDTPERCPDTPDMFAKGRT